MSRIQNKGEIAPRSPMRIPETVLNYCDVDKDCRLSKTELNGFLNYMQNMKCIDRKDVDNGAKFVGSLKNIQEDIRCCNE